MQSIIQKQVCNGNFEVSLDCSQHVLRLHAPVRKIEVEASSASGADSFAGAAVVPDPVLSFARQKGTFISAAVLAQKAKQFDDGLMAAVDVLASVGCSQLMGRAKLVKEIVAAALRENPEDNSPGLSLLSAALQLRQVYMPGSDELTARSSALLKSFLTNSIASKPMGFYTWSELLTSIFRFDRMLQAQLDDTEFASVISQLAGSSALKEAYLKHLYLLSKSSSRLMNNGLSECLTNGTRFNSTIGCNQRQVAETSDSTLTDGFGSGSYSIFEAHRSQSLSAQL